MFSVVIPLYNKADFIEETIKSVIAQTFADFEIIVVNDSSTDNSLDIVNNIKDPRIHLYTKTNEGVSAARNFGISKANREIVAFLDADDKWEPDYLESIHKLVREYPSAGVYASEYYIIERGKKKSVNHIASDCETLMLDDYFKASLDAGVSVTSMSSTCVRKTILDNMPLFRVGIKRGEDIDVWLRIAIDHSVAFYNRPKVFYRTNTPNSLSTHYTTSKEDFPYEEWLSYSSNSKYYTRYVVMVMYELAKRGFKNRDYKTCSKYIALAANKEMKYKSAKRLYLLIASSAMRIAKTLF